MRFEYQLLSTICNEPSCLSNLDLKPEHFGDRKAGEMFEVVTELVNAKKTPDIIMLIESLNFRGGDWSEFVSGVLMDYPAVPNNVKTYESEIKKAYRKREIQRAAQRFLFDANNGDETAVSTAMENLKRIESGSDRAMKHVSEIIPDVIQRIDDAFNNRGPVGVNSGLTDLDRLTGGFQPTDLIILAARTAVGKTATMVNFALNAGVPVGVISAEQSSDQLVQRMLANIGEVSAQRLRTGRLDDAEWPRLVSASTMLQSSNIVIADKSLPSIDEVEQMTRRLQWEHGIKILFVDYLQYIRSNKYEQKYQQIGDVSSRLKGLAKECNIPIVALAQLNRQADGRQPRLSDLRESGDIEQDADQIILLSKDEERPTVIYLDVAKNRHGPTARIEGYWDAKFMKLRDFAR